MSPRLALIGLAFALAAGMMQAVLDRPVPEPVITAQRVAEVAEQKADLAPCDGLWIRQCAAAECWLRDVPVQCVESADLTEARPLPNHILTLPLAETKR